MCITLATDPLMCPDMLDYVLHANEAVHYSSNGTPIMRIWHGPPLPWV